MSFLDHARARLDEHLTGLDKQLADVGLHGLEQVGSDALSMFRSAGGPALLVPEAYGGLGATLADAVQVQRAIGARSPSLAVATAMHHFSVASLVELAVRHDGLEWAMLEAIAANRWLLSSAFAEGRSGAHILSPTMRGVRVADGLRVTGSKKPCSLTWSMDLLSASVAVVDPAGGPDRLAVILVPADTPGIERRPFWRNTVLAAAESDEVVLEDVHVLDALVFTPEDGPTMDPVHTRGFTCFTLLIAASYVGIASGLAERVVTGGRGSATDRALLAVELESATAALAHVATVADDGSDPGDVLAQALFARYAAERAVERTAMAASALAGGMAFIGSDDVSYLLAAARALAFHPPALGAAAEPLAAHLVGAELVLEAAVDSHNLFLTPATSRLLRLEFAAGLATAVVLTATHLDQVRWGVFVGLFVAIDLVGYLPGAIAFRRSPTGRISRTYHVLYNVAHNGLTAGAVALLWTWWVGAEWALLALPVHLCGDRALFGNFPKPFGLTFEPSTHPAYQELVQRYEPFHDRHPTRPLVHPFHPVHPVQPADGHPAGDRGTTPSARPGFARR